MSQRWSRRETEEDKENVTPVEERQRDWTQRGDRNKDRSERGQMRAEEEIEVQGERGKGRQMLKADKQQSVASCVSSLRLNNKTAEQRKKKKKRTKQRR